MARFHPVLDFLKAFSEAGFDIRKTLVKVEISFGWIAYVNVIETDPEQVKIIKQPGTVV
jgi:hypothetical protein